MWSQKLTEAFLKITTLWLLYRKMAIKVFLTFKIKGNCCTMQKKVEVHWPKCNYESFSNQFFSFLLAFIDLYAFVVRQKPPSGTGGISTDYTKQPHSPSQSWKTTIGLLHLYAND